MSSARMKDQKDFDLEQIVKVLDQALESDDQRIKDALRALMTITVLCTAEHPDQVLTHGPLSRLFEDMRNLNQRLGRLEDELKKEKENVKTIEVTKEVIKEVKVEDNSKMDLIQKTLQELRKEIFDKNKKIKEL